LARSVLSANCRLHAWPALRYHRDALAVSFDAL
jgi:hypothetical protein